MNNSAYTNAAAASALRDAAAAAQLLGKTAPASWTTVADGLVKTIPYDASQGIYDEFDGLLCLHLHAAQLRAVPARAV